MVVLKFLHLNVVMKGTLTNGRTCIIFSLHRTRPYFDMLWKFSKTDKDKKFEIFWAWVKKLRGNEHNQVCRFWAQMLIYLNAYTGFYFSICSGNWLLRNSCLKLLTELFAYSRDKYEVVQMHLLIVTLTQQKS